MRDQAPPQPIKGPLARLRVFADNEMLLTGCSVVAWVSVKWFDKRDYLEPELVRRGRLGDGGGYRSLKLSAMHPRRVLTKRSEPSAADASIARGLNAPIAVSGTRSFR